MSNSRQRVVPVTRNPDLEQQLVIDIGKGSDAQRNENVVDTGGEPIISFDGKSNPYLDHQRNDLLLSIQHLRSDAHDEMVFIIMTHCKELTFKAIHYELANIAHRIKHDDVAGALVLFPRVRRLFEYLVKTWDVLSTITPASFAEFRNTLGIASGQQSYMYRHVEFIMGNKSRRLARAHENNPDVWPYMREALENPSLYDEVIFLLHRRGFELPDSALVRDWADAYEPLESVEEAWLRVYADATPENELYLLGEALLDVADLFSQYRWRHFTSVQRILGLKVGTGGSAGVGWLKHVLDHRFFPELWSVRTRL